MSEISIIGLDLSTSCSGYCRIVLQDTEIKHIECFEIKPKQSWKTPDRCKYMAEAIELLVYQSETKVVWAEDIGTRFIQTAMGMGRVHQAVAQKVAGVNRVDVSQAYRTLSPSKLKQFATGKGNAKKDQMIEAAKEVWNRDFTDNEADALWVARFGATVHLMEN